MSERDRYIRVRLSEEERRIIDERMKTIGVKNLSAYIRKMAMKGYYVVLDLSDVKEVLRLLRICSNNLNQYAKRANETGSFYKTDIQDVKIRLDEIWELMREILKRLSSIE